MHTGNEIMTKDRSPYQLSICIPNFNRMEMLRRLLEGISGQIAENKLEREVEISVSDDCSETNPLGIIEEIKSRFPKVAIVYTRNRVNMGMDYNFVNCVTVAHGRYAWIVGNDDAPAEGALGKILNLLGEREYQDIDIIVTPFDSYSYNGDFVGTVYPLGNHTMENVLFDTVDKEQMHRLIMAVKDNSAVFGFLSNVVFKRERWLQHGSMFEDKMSSIFIQIYMNLQTLKEGAKYLYTPQKIIKNYLDDETNQTIDRTYRIAAGLYDAMDYFFEGEERVHMEEQVVDIFMASAFLEFQDTDARKEKADSFISERMDILRKYYVRQNIRAQYFSGKTIVIYGAGRFGREAYEDLKRYKADIIGFCDADANKQGTYIETKPVFDFERLSYEYHRSVDCVVVVANNRHLVYIIRNLLCHRMSRIAIIT